MAPIQEETAEATEKWERCIEKKPGFRYNIQVSNIMRSAHLRGK